MAPKGKKPKPTYADHMPQRLKDTTAAGEAAVKVFDDAVNGIAPRYTTTNELDTDELCLVLISEAHFPRKKVTAKKCYLRSVFDGRKNTQVRISDIHVACGSRCPPIATQFFQTNLEALGALHPKNLPLLKENGWEVWYDVTVCRRVIAFASIGRPFHPMI